MNRTLVWQLAWRYLRGKRSANAVPILSRISMVAIAVGACAMIVLFSVFNGLEGLVKDLYKAFYPDIKITAAQGKFFTPAPAQLAGLHALKGIQDMSFVAEDNVMANSVNKDNTVATVKGVDKAFFKVNDIDTYITGRRTVEQGLVPTAILGAHVAANLAVDPDNAFSKITLYYPNTEANMSNALDLANAFHSLELKADGVFNIQDELDKYLIAPLPLVQQLFGREGQVSSLELKLAPGVDVEALQAEIKKTMGNAFHVETRFEQNKTLYMVMRTEKWAVYAILLLVLIIASFNMIGALSLLVLDKQKDMAILRAMGAQPSLIRRVFMLEGLLWSLLGGGIGLVLGTLLCMGQYHFHWIKLQGSFIIEAYPVQMQATDFLLIIITIIVIGLTAAWYPALRAQKTGMPGLKS